ncbi:hypothetical protein R3P38DRAFT_3372805 [Favolaschia claudopus]|uniref:Uncharacterized protein n=1 Tax=Favolaschia claudopus TaxID=2862362 RepID=A0AAV9ZTX5_9AGAR
MHMRENRPSAPKLSVSYWRRQQTRNLRDTRLRVHGFQDYENNTKILPLSPNTFTWSFNSSPKTFSQQEDLEFGTEAIDAHHGIPCYGERSPVALVFLQPLVPSHVFFLGIAVYTPHRRRFAAPPSNAESCFDQLLYAPHPEFSLRRCFVDPCRETPIVLTTSHLSMADGFGPVPHIIRSKSEEPYRSAAEACLGAQIPIQYLFDVVAEMKVWTLLLIDELHVHTVCENR